MISLYKIKIALVSIVIAFTAAKGQNQNPQVGHLKSELQKTPDDTAKINILNEIASAYKYSEAEEGLLYGNKALALAEKKSWVKGMADANENLGICSQTLSDYTETNIFPKSILFK